MAKYQIYVFCNHCGETHPMPIQINLNDGPSKKTSVADFYNGKEVPSDVCTLSNNTLTCPKTRKTFVQKDNNQTFMVPV